MAQPTTTVVRASAASADDHRNLNALTDALASHEESLEAWLRLLDALQESGLMEMATALVKRGDGVLDILVNKAQKPESVSAIKNFTTIIAALSQIDFTKWVGLAAETSKAVDVNNAPRVEGMWDFIKAFRDEDVVRGLGVGLQILKGLGQAASKVSEYESGRNLGNDAV